LLHEKKIISRLCEKLRVKLVVETKMENSFSENTTFKINFLLLLNVDKWKISNDFNMC